MSGGFRCIGGLTVTGQSVRLLDSGGSNWPSTCEFRVGEVWSIRYNPSQSVTPPHVEDVCVTNAQKLSDEPNLRQFIQASYQIWRGPISNTFDGRLSSTQNGSLYALKPNLPAMSTGYWVPNEDLMYSDEGYYQWGSIFDHRRIKFIGEQSVLSTISKGTLVRLSLARWWRPDRSENVEDRCYLQLSGWYL
jgi:hypothetical protein